MINSSDDGAQVVLHEVPARRQGVHRAGVAVDDVEAVEGQEHVGDDARDAAQQRADEHGDAVEDGRHDVVAQVVALEQHGDVGLLTTGRGQRGPDEPEGDHGADHVADESERQAEEDAVDHQAQAEEHQDHHHEGDGDGDPRTDIRHELGPCPAEGRPEVEGHGPATTSGCAATTSCVTGLVARSLLGWVPLAVGRLPPAWSLRCIAHSVLLLSGVRMSRTLASTCPGGRDSTAAPCATVCVELGYPARPRGSPRHRPNDFDW